MDLILFMLQGIEETATWTTAKISSIRQLMAAAVEHVRTTTPKIYRRELVDLVVEQPYCRITTVVEAGIAGRQAASRSLQALVWKHVRVGYDRPGDLPPASFLETGGSH